MSYWIERSLLDLTREAATEARQHGRPEVEWAASAILAAIPTLAPGSARLLAAALLNSEAD